MKISVYAFANTGYFFDSLIEESRARGDAVEWSAILPRWHHHQRFKSLLTPEKVLYLYERYDEIYASRDASAAFGLSAEGNNELLCLLKDKAGYRFLDTQEQLRRAGAVVQIYRAFLERERPDYMLFPDLEVVDGFLLISLCKSMGITPIYYVGMRTLGGGFFSTDAEEGLPPYFGPYVEQDVGRARDFLANFLAGKSFSFEPQMPPATTNLVSASLWKRIPQALHMHFRYERRYAGEDGWVNRMKANAARLLNAYRAWYFRIFQLSFFDLRDDDEALPVKYVLYALQYTPESSINGIEPYFVDQMRAIDLLLAGMPSDCRLVVKEHPAITGLRATAFYRRLRRKPGVVLAAPGLSTRRLMAEASVVASVTGTVGFESYLLGKPCLLFGRNFFSHLCALGEGPSSIRRVMSRLFEDFQAPSEDARALGLARLLYVRYPILLSDPVAQPDVLSRRNVQAFIEALHDHIGRLEKLVLEPRG